MTRESIRGGTKEERLRELLEPKDESAVSAEIADLLFEITQERYPHLSDAEDLSKLADANILYNAAKKIYELSGAEADKIEAVQLLIEEVEAKCLDASASVLDNWEQVENDKKHVDTIASDAIEALNADGDIVEIYKNIASELDSFAGGLYKDAFKFLGVSYEDIKDEFSICSLGSLARFEATPYSDFESKIILKDPQNEELKELLRKASHYVNFRLQRLGQTQVKFELLPDILDKKHNFDHLIKGGFQFDLGGKTPLNRPDEEYDMINSIKGFSAYSEQRLEKHIGDKESINLLPIEMFSYRYLLGNESLVTEYKGNLSLKYNKQKVSSPYNPNQDFIYFFRKDIKYGQERGRELLANCLKTFPPKLLNPELRGKAFNAKSELYRFFDRALEALMNYVGKVGGEDFVSKIKFLTERGLFNEAQKNNLIAAYKLALEFRLRSYAASKGQVEDFSFALDDEAMREKLYKFYAHLIPFYQALEQFKNGDISSFAEIGNDFYVDQPCYRGLVDIRLKDYDAAIVSFTAATGSKKDGLSLHEYFWSKKYLAIAQIERGDAYDDDLVNNLDEAISLLRGNDQLREQAHEFSLIDLYERKIEYLLRFHEKKGEALVACGECISELEKFDNMQELVNQYELRITALSKRVTGGVEDEQEYLDRVNRAKREDVRVIVGQMKAEIIALLKEAREEKAHIKEWVSNLPEEIKPYIVTGKEDQLIKELQQESRLYIHNMRGAGKTEFLIKFAHQQQQFYQGNIRLFHASSKQVLVESFREFAQELGYDVTGLDAQGLVEKIYEHINALDRYLLIFDAAAETKDWLGYIRNNAGQNLGHHIIVSSDLPPKQLDNFAVFSEDLFNEELALDLANKTLESLKYDKEICQKSLAKLIGDVGCSPLAVRQVCFSLKQDPRDMITYAQEFSSADIKSSSEVIDPAYRYNNTDLHTKHIHKLWEDIFEKLEAKAQENPAYKRAFALLNMSAYLVGEKIKFNFWGQVELRESLEMLSQEYGLIREGIDSYSVHNNIRDAVLRRNAHINIWLEKVLLLLNDKFAYDIHDKNRRFDYLEFVPHIEKSVAILQKSKASVHDMGIIELLNKYARYLHYDADEHILALEVLDFAEKSCANPVTMAEKIVKAQIYNVISDTCLALGQDVRRVKENCKQVEILLADSDGVQEHKIYAEMYNIKACLANRVQDKWSQIAASLVSNDFLSRLQRRGIKSSMTYLENLENIADAYLALKDKDLAEQYYQKRKQLLKPNSVEIFNDCLKYCQIFVPAKVYKNIEGCLSEATELCLQAENIFGSKKRAYYEAKSLLIYLEYFSLKEQVSKVTDLIADLEEDLKLVPDFSLSEKARFAFFRARSYRGLKKFELAYEEAKLMLELQADHFEYQMFNMDVLNMSCANKDELSQRLTHNDISEFLDKYQDILNVQHCSFLKMLCDCLEYEDLLADLQDIQGKLFEEPEIDLALCRNLLQRKKTANELDNDIHTEYFLALIPVLAKVADDKKELPLLSDILGSFIDLDRQNQDLYWCQAMLLNKLGRIDELLQIITTSLEIGPDHELSSLAAKIHMQAENQAEARNYLQQAINTSPSEHKARYQRYYTENFRNMTEENRESLGDECKGEEEEKNKMQNCCLVS